MAELLAGHVECKAIDVMACPMTSNHICIFESRTIIIHHQAVSPSDRWKPQTIHQWRASMCCVIFFAMNCVRAHTHTHTTHTHTCMHIHTCMHTHTHTHAYTHSAYTCTHIHIYARTHTCMHIHSQMHTHTRTRTLIHTHACTYTHTNAHTHTHTLVHTLIHTHTHRLQGHWVRATGGNLPKFIIFSAVNVKLQMLWSGGETSALHICCTHGASPEESRKGNSQWSHSFYLIYQELAVMLFFSFLFYN